MVGVLHSSVTSSSRVGQFRAWAQRTARRHGARHEAGVPDAGASFRRRRRLSWDCCPRRTGGPRGPIRRCVGPRAAEPGVPGPDDRLRAGGQAELGEDVGDVVAERLGADLEPRRDLGVVEAAGDEVEDLGLAGRQRRERDRRDRAGGRLHRRAEEVVHLGHELPERGLAFEQQVVPAFEGDESRVGDQGRQQAALLVRHAGVLTRVEHQRRTGDLRREVADVDGGELGEQPGRVLGRGGDALELVEPAATARAYRRG